MKLLTKEIKSNIPALGDTEYLSNEEKVIYAKFFTPDANWTWYVLEYDGKDTFFGLVKGLETEYGYFSLYELEHLRGPLGLPVERDRHFRGTLADVLRKSLQ